MNRLTNKNKLSIEYQELSKQVDQAKIDLNTRLIKIISMTDIIFKFAIVEKNYKLTGRNYECDYLSVSLQDLQLFEIQLSDLRKNHLEPCQKIIDMLSQDQDVSNTDVHVCSPDYGAHFYVGLIKESGIKYFVSYESYDDENDATFRLKIPLDKCDKDSLIICMKKIKDFISTSTVNMVRNVVN